MLDDDIEQIYGWQKPKHVFDKPVQEPDKKIPDKFTPEIAEECLRQMREVIAFANPYENTQNNEKRL